MTFFKKKIDDFRISQNFFEDWEYIDGKNSQKKIMSKISVLLRWNIYSHNFDNNYSLFNLAIFVYIFYNKDKFTNFKIAIKIQEFLFGINIIIIEN